METGMKNYGKPNHDGVTNTWDLIQSNFQCCGVKNKTDWKDVLGAGTYPDSCCVGGTVQDCGKAESGQEMYGVGCLTQFTNFFSHNLNYVGGKTTFA